MNDVVSRRRFLKGAGAGFAACVVEGSAKLRANPYGKPVGLQLYTVRDHMKNDLEGTLKAVHEIGYREVELGSFDFYGKKPGVLRRIIDDHGLKAISTHFTEPQWKSNPDKCIADAKACGLTYTGLASLDENSRKTLDAVKRDADWFNQIGETATRSGCHFIYHGHDFDYATLPEGQVIYDTLISRTDSRFANFELDCFWCVWAGKDPVDYFHRFPGRFPQLHIKDVKRGYSRSMHQGAHFQPFAPVGQGEIDWRRIFKAAPKGGMKHFYVEQDECDADTLESAKISYDYLHKLTV